MHYNNVADKIKRVSHLLVKKSETLHLSKEGELATGIRIEENNGVYTLFTSPDNEFGIPEGSHGPSDYVSTKWGLKSLAQLLISIARKHRLRARELNILKRYMAQFKNGPKLED